MAITLITGVPGAGKTLRSIHELLEKKGEGRPVFHIGIDGMKPEIVPASPYPIEEWNKLPAGSVLVVDEAHKYFPVRQPGRPPQWIQDLTEIRHFGIELILVSQDPRNIDAFVRRLIGVHKHLTRKAGLNGAMVRTFQGVSEDPNDYTNRQSSEQVPWKYPKHLFQAYESASLHVVKPKIPKKIIFAILLGVSCVIAIPAAIWHFGSTVETFDENQGKPANGFSSITPKSSTYEQVSYDTLADYMKAITPLTPVAPWTAPIYAPVRQVKSIPSKLACYIGSKGCRCFTEQMTRVPLPEPVCTSLVHDGIYSPYHQAYATTPAAGGEPAAPAVGGNHTPSSPPVALIEQSPGTITGGPQPPENGG